jgi:hypothetical protein
VGLGVALVEGDGFLGGFLALLGFVGFEEDG